MKLERPASLRKDNCRSNSTEKLIHRDGGSFHQSVKALLFARAIDGRYKFAAVCITRREIYTSIVVECRFLHSIRNAVKTTETDAQTTLKTKIKKKKKKKLSEDSPRDRAPATSR